MYPRRNIILPLQRLLQCWEFHALRMVPFESNQSWVQTNARFNFCRTSNLHKFCSMTVVKQFCFYCMFYFCRGVCAKALMPSAHKRGFALPLPEQPFPPAQATYPVHAGEKQTALLPRLWVGGDASTSIPRLCWDSTAAGLLSAELSLSSQWNISSWPKPALALWTSALVTRAFADNNTMHCNCIIRIVKNPGTHNAFTSYKYFQKNLWLKAQIILQCSLVYSITLFLLQDDLYITLNFKFSRTVKIFV